MLFRKRILMNNPGELLLLLKCEPWDLPRGIRAAGPTMHKGLYQGMTSSRAAKVEKTWASAPAEPVLESLLQSDANSKPVKELRWKRENSRKIYGKTPELPYVAEGRKESCCLRS
jgi:hypothetical protein